VQRLAIWIHRAPGRCAAAGVLSGRRRRKGRGRGRGRGGGGGGGKQRGGGREQCTTCIRRRRSGMARRNEHPIPAGEIHANTGRACATGYRLGRARERGREGMSSAAEARRREDGLAPDGCPRGGRSREPAAPIVRRAWLERSSPGKLTYANVEERPTCCSLATARRRSSKARTADNKNRVFQSFKNPILRVPVGPPWYKPSG